MSCSSIVFAISVMLGWKKFNKVDLQYMQVEMNGIEDLAALCYLKVNIIITRKVRIACSCSLKEME